MHPTPPVPPPLPPPTSDDKQWNWSGEGQIN